MATSTETATQKLIVLSHVVRKSKRIGKNTLKDSMTQMLYKNMKRFKEYIFALKLY